MAQVDSNIALGVRPVELADPLAMYTKAAQAQNFQLQSQAAQLGLQKDQGEMAQAKTAAQVYREAMGQDGNIDRNKLMRGYAAQGLGAKIPAMQKSFADADKAAGDVAKDKAATIETTQKTMYEGMKIMDNTMASLAADPNLTDQRVYAEVARMVNSGAFKGPAQHQGKTEDQVAMDMLSTMPRGNPAALKAWIMSNASRAADATKRFEMMLPKYDEQNRGGVLNLGTINPMTGERTDGRDVTLSADPNAVLSANTSRSNAGLADRRAKEFNDIQKEAQRVQIVQTADGGFARIDKGTGAAIPVSGLQAKDSAPAANTRMAGDMMQNITEARTLLKKATGSPVGALVDKAVGLTGQSTVGADASAQLATLGGWMTANVPRMQGPQSDKDTALYRQMAGDVADSTKPVSQRLAALDTLEKLQQKYLPGGGQYSPPGVVAPAGGARSGGPMATPPRGRPAAPAAPAARPSLDDFFQK